MSRKVLIVGGILVAFGLGSFGFGGASASPHRDHVRKVLMTEPFDTSSETDTDLGEPGLSQGDISAFHFEVYDRTGTVHLGYENSQCEIGSVIDNVATFTCSSDFTLTGGQIITEGTLEFPASMGPRVLRRPGENLLTVHFAVTGGTGMYMGAQGQLDWGSNDVEVLLGFSFLED